LISLRKTGTARRERRGRLIDFSLFIVFRATKKRAKKGMRAKDSIPQRKVFGFLHRKRKRVDVFGEYSQNPATETASGALSRKLGNPDLEPRSEMIVHRRSAHDER